MKRYKAHLYMREYHMWEDKGASMTNRDRAVLGLIMTLMILGIL